MAAHLRKCDHAPEQAKADAEKEERLIKEREEKKKQEKIVDAAKRMREEEELSSSLKRMKGPGGSVPKPQLHQSKLKVFKGIDIPFTPKEKPLVQRQFLRATISANLPYRWTQDPEVIKLFEMF
jgi:hypothetical protein